MEKKKQVKEEKEKLLSENRHFEAKISMAHKNSSFKKKTNGNRRKSKINKGDVGAIKGHIGSFSNGVLKIKKSDLKMLNK